MYIVLLLKYYTSAVLYLEIVDLLLKHDAMLKIKNSDGWIPLDEAISYGNREMSEATIAQCLNVFSITMKSVIYIWATVSYFI